MSGSSWFTVEPWMFPRRGRPTGKVFASVGGRLCTGLLSQAPELATIDWFLLSYRPQIREKFWRILAPATRSFGPAPKHFFVSDNEASNLTPHFGCIAPEYLNKL